MIRRWDKSKPPTGPFALNRDCPQAQGLVAWYPMGMASGGNYFPDLAGKHHLSRTGSVPITLGKSGEPMASFNGSTSNYLSGTTVPLTTFPLTLAARVVFAASATSTVVSLCKSSSANDYFTILPISGPGVVRSQWGDIPSPSDSIASTASNYVLGVDSDLIAAVSSATNGSVYLNGGSKGTYSGPETNSPADINTIGIGILADNGGPGVRLPFTGLIGEVSIYNRAFDDDAARLHADKGRRFELWYPLRSRKWIVGAAAPTITALSARLITATSAQPRISYS